MFEDRSHKIDIDEIFLSSPNALIGDLKLSSGIPAFAGMTTLLSLSPPKSFIGGLIQWY